MADDQTQDAIAAPAFDVDALASQVADRLKESFQQAPQPQRYSPPAPPAPADPVGDVVKPYVEPVARMARLAEESATDAADFYTSHTDLDKETRQEIERRFQSLRANGVPFKREDILNHYYGENLDKVVEKRIKTREEAAARAANAAATVGAGSPDKSVRITDPHSMSLSELEKALDGISF